VPKDYKWHGKSLVVQLLVGEGYGKFVVEEELEVSL
jgi:hypothetical protein